MIEGINEKIIQSVNKKKGLKIQIKKKIQTKTKIKFRRPPPITDHEPKGLVETRKNLFILFCGVCFETILSKE